MVVLDKIYSCVSVGPESLLKTADDHTLRLRDDALIGFVLGGKYHIMVEANLMIKNYQITITKVV